MIIDNFDNIETILQYDDNTGDPIVYQIDLIERKKDGVDTSGCQNSARRITSFYPENMEQWNKYKSRIKDLCNARPGLRAYINPNPKRASAIMKQMFLDLSDRMYHSAFTGLHKFFPSSIAKTRPESNKSLWIVDLDSDDNFNISDFINHFKLLFPEAEAVLNPSKSGMHLLCKPFNRKAFMDWTRGVKWSKKSDVFIHVNSLTNLYINTGDENSCN